MPLNVQYVNNILAILRLNIEISTNEYDANINEPLTYLRLYNADKNKIGRCRFYLQEENNRLSYIQNIDIYYDAEKNKGYGTILLYAALCKMQELNVTGCNLRCKPGTAEFYYKNGFCLEDDKDINAWFQYDINEKKLHTFNFDGGGYEYDEYFKCQDDARLELAFILENESAINLINEKLFTIAQKIFNIEMPEIKRILSASEEETLSKQEREAYVISRMNFFQGLGDPEIVRDSIKSDQNYFLTPW